MISYETYCQIRLFHKEHGHTVVLEGSSYRMKDRAES